MEELQLKGLNDTENPQPQTAQVRNKMIRKCPEIRKDITKLETNGFKMVENQVMDNPTSGKRLTDTSLVLVEPHPVNQSNLDLNDTINSMMEIKGTGRGFACKVCGKIEMKKKNNMQNHIEGMHIEGVTHPCSQCGKSFRWIIYFLCMCSNITFRNKQLARPL